MEGLQAVYPENTDEYFHQLVDDQGRVAAYVETDLDGNDMITWVATPEEQK